MSIEATYTSLSRADEQVSINPRIPSAATASGFGSSGGQNLAAAKRHAGGDGVRDASIARPLYLSCCSMNERPSGDGDVTVQPLVTLILLYLASWGLAPVEPASRRSPFHAASSARLSENQPNLFSFCTTRDRLGRAARPAGSAADSARGRRGRRE